MQRRPPPASWLALAGAAIRANAGVEVEHLVDPDDAALAWCMSGRDPRELELDAIDRALAEWMREHTVTTRETYQLSLRCIARALEFSALRPVREMLELVIVDPDALDERLAGLAEVTGWRSGTIRNRLSALHRASRALLAARLARRTVADERPRNVDLEIEEVTPEQVAAIDAALAKSLDPLAARTRAVLLLAWNLALRPEQIERVRVSDLHLARACVVVDEELAYCGQRAAEAVGVWLKHRGRAPGTLFAAYDTRARRISRRPMTMRSLQRSIADAGAALKISITLRALRNGALRELAAFDRRAAQRLSRNASEDGVNRLMRAAPGGT